MKQIAAWRKNKITFQDQVLKFPDGSSYGKNLDPWQREDMIALLETEKNTWRELPRGHSKTMDSAALALTELFLAAPGQRIYFAAADRDQAALALDSVRSFIAASVDILRGAVKVVKDTATVEALDSSLKILPADAPGSWGLRPTLIVFDELTAWRGEPAEEFFYSLYSSLGKVEGARCLVITTAGWDKTSLAWKLREKIIDDPGWNFLRRGQTASWISPEFLEQQKRILPVHVNQMLHDNEWSEAGGAFLTFEEVSGVFVPEMFPIKERREGDHFIGLDLGLSNDAAVGCVVHYENEKVIVDQFRTWQGSKKDRVDLQDVEHWTRAAVENYSRAKVIADPWQAVGMVQRLKADGFDVEEFTFSQKSRDQMFANLLDLIRNKQLKSFEHETLKDELLQLHFIEKNGHLRVDHRPGGYDDHVIALALAALVAVQSKKKPFIFV